MAKIFVDNKPFEMKDGGNLLHACLSLGFNIPYFCWHPAMHSVGACRQCAVKQFKDENDKKGKIVMSCMTAVQDGMRISIDDPEAREFRASVIEWLMLNHPHDCPVCDEGGECHLQDMTVMTGHAYRRTRSRKRTYRNQYLGPFVNHEMNRCIQCYRCVRFYRDYAGGRDLNVFAAHDHVYFGRQEDGILENEFSGNLVEVCPTGVFTDKTLRKHYTRAWDLQTAPSVCVHCGLGCNTIPGERYGTLRRIRNRYNGEVNGYFLCDRGRFGYEFVNDALRIRKPVLSSAKSTTGGPVSKDEAMGQVASLLYFGAKVIGIGSPRASLEANYALRSLVGHENFYAGISDQDNALMSTIIRIMEKGPSRSSSLSEAGAADAVLVLGEDLLNTAPMAALALRQSVRQKPMEIARRLNIPLWNDAGVREAVQQEKGPLFIASPAATALDEIATHTYRGAPDDLARLGFAVAHEITDSAPPVEGLPEETLSLAREIARALKEAERPLVISGTGCGSETVLQAAANIAWALCEGGCKGQISFIVPECNSMGLALLNGGDLSKAIREIEQGNAETVIILENNLYRRDNQGTVDNFFARASNVIVLDHYFHKTTFHADIVLPAGTFAESSGTLVSNEGRAQRFYSVYSPQEDIQESWRWIREMMAVSGKPDADRFKTLDTITEAISEDLSLFKTLRDIAPGADFRMAGQKIPRQPHRYSGRTAMQANISVHEPKPPGDPDSPLSFSMEGYDGRPPAPFIPRYWAPGWNSVQSLNKFQDEVGGPLSGGDPGIRLMYPRKSGKVNFFTHIPPSFQHREDVWYMVPLYHLFGSEELSARSPTIAERMPQPCVGLNPGDAAALGVQEGEEVSLTLDDKERRLPVRYIPSLVKGTAGMPIGLPGLSGVLLPSWATIRTARGKE